MYFIYLSTCTQIRVFYQCTLSIYLPVHRYMYFINVLYLSIYLYTYTCILPMYFIYLSIHVLYQCTLSIYLPVHRYLFFINVLYLSIYMYSDTCILSMYFIYLFTCTQIPVFYQCTLSIYLPEVPQQIICLKSTVYHSNPNQH